MKIEAGKYYRTRDGRKVGPMEYRPQSLGDAYPYFCTTRYTSNGKIFNDSSTGFGADLIAEWTDEPTPWKDMTDAEKGALLLARINGATLQTKAYGSDWLDKDFSNNKFHSDFVYRIKPAPVVETKEHTWNCAYGFHGDDGPDDPKTTHRITFDTVDGVPDCSTVKMEKL